MLKKFGSEKSIRRYLIVNSGGIISRTTKYCNKINNNGIIAKKITIPIHHNNDFLVRSKTVLFKSLIKSLVSTMFLNKMSLAFY